MSRKTACEADSLPAGSAACIPSHECGGLTPRFAKYHPLGTSYFRRLNRFHSPIDCNYIMLEYAGQVK
jgi:hypothetical protein